MANRYWVGGTSTWDATAGTKWATTSGGAGGSAVPTAADDVFLDNGAGTGNITGTTSAVCRSLDCTGYVNTLTISAGQVISIGTTTAGPGNVALILVSGMTLTLGNSASGFTFNSTSATQQTILTAGKNAGAVGIGATGGSYILSGAITAGTFTVSAGTFNTGNFAMTLSVFNYGNATTRTITLGSSVISVSAVSTAWTGSGVTGLTITANTAVVTSTGAASSTNNVIVLFGRDWSGLSFVITGGGQGALSVGGGTIANLTITGTASQNDSYRISSSFTITGTLTINGNSVLNRPTIYSFVVGTAVTITAAITSLSNVDFRDITAAGAGSWAITSGYIGDKLGNTGISLTTGAATTMNTAGSTNDSTKWSGGRVPLPQDDVTISGSAAISLNAQVIGKSVDISSYTGTMSLISSNFNYELYGNVTLGSGMTWGASPNTFYIALNGRGTHTITSNGKAFFPAGSNGNVFIQTPGGSYSLQDAFSAISPASTSFNAVAGSFVSNSYSMSVGRFTANGSISRSITLGTSVVSLVGITALVMITLNTTGLTLSIASATFNITGVSTFTRSIDLSGAAIPNINYTLAGSTGQLTFTTSGYVDILNFSDASNARTLAITSGQTLSVNTFNVNGTAGKLMTVKGLTGGSAGYLEILSAPSNNDYLSVQDIYSVIPNKFYAGSTSTDVSGNTNVLFTTYTTGPYISLRADNYVTTNTTITATLPYLLTPVVGRMIVVAQMAVANPGTITPPTGFTQITTIGTAPGITVYRKISDGTETAFTFTTTNSVSQALKVYSIGGITGTPTVDVTDQNSTASTVTSLSTNGTSPTNTAQPAIAIAFFAANGSQGASVSATNSFGALRDSTELIMGRVASKQLTSLAAVSSTYTWTTARAAAAQLVVIKDVSSGTGNFFRFF